MSLLPLVGHDLARHELIHAVRSDRLPQVLLVTGAEGVGKQRFALWLAQLLFCSSTDDRPCGRCRGCQQVLGLSHADLHWFVPVPRPKAGDPDKLVDEVGEMLEGVMAERRQSPLWTPPDGMAIHGIASARLLQRQSVLKPVEGGWRVFIIGHAERLVPQEASPEAANSLLKLLEEPPQRTLFVLTTAEPGLVLPTIRSRATPVRLGRLADADVRAFLAQANPALATDEVVRRGHGAIGTVLAGSGEGMGQARSAARSFLAGVQAGPAAVERVLRQGPWQARGDFTDLLDAMAGELAESARSAALRGDRVSLDDGLPALDGMACVLRARERARGNVNPQLLLAVLADELINAGVG